MLLVDWETLAPTDDSMTDVNMNFVQIYMLKPEFQQKNSYR